MRYPLPWFPISDGPRRCNCRTTRDCRSYWSFRTVCRFGRSGSSGFVGGFRCLRSSSCGPAPRVRVYRTCPSSELEVSCGLRLAKINHTYHKFHEYNLLLIFLFFVLLLMHSKEFYSTTYG